MSSPLGIKSKLICLRAEIQAFSTDNYKGNKHIQLHGNIFSYLMAHTRCKKRAIQKNKLKLRNICSTSKIFAVCSGDFKEYCNVSVVETLYFLLDVFQLYFLLDVFQPDSILRQCILTIFAGHRNVMQLYRPL
jgi:hypothetical protein